MHTNRRNIIRGPRTTTIRNEARICAERRGFHWLTNTDPSVQFDGLMYRMAVVVAVILKKVRYGLSSDCIIENKFPDDVADLRILPLPQYVLRELWVRTQNERAWRRFYILPETTAEIEYNTAEGYLNTHFRETYWKEVPYRIDITLMGSGKDEVK